ncbi:DUF998 domain-containing protein [Nonomuraea soli]|uniref:DUF998 domain-containing protein n=1 Tax=Nonomuraea soli TaxID=1032476 RepID=A0A7W0HTK1_9ACTN|nr:DUF998 domain-containing protein [Nonomuraea soli]MBA2895238.1 hypothetical protein [Nonomuraea soli]
MTAIATTTRALLVAGTLAAPLWAALSLAQAALREPFDLTRHPLSMLALGDLGWLQIANFVVAGVLFVAGSYGLRRTSGSVWLPRLTGIVGIGMIASGLLVMDPGAGFPAGYDAIPTTMSWHSLGHMAAGSITFLTLSAACFVLARHQGSTAGKVVSRLAGAGVLVANAYAMSGGAAGSLVLAAGVIPAMLWLSAAHRSQLGA